MRATGQPARGRMSRKIECTLAGQGNGQARRPVPGAGARENGHFSPAIGTIDRCVLIYVVSRAGPA
jgi:hypothetical protein